jgi:Tol biopolymer transport system component
MASASGADSGVPSLSLAVDASPDASGGRARWLSGGPAEEGPDEVAGPGKLWLSRYDGPGNGTDAAYALGVSPDGSKLFITGASDGATGDDDYATVAYDAATGTKLWVSRYDGPGNGSDAASALGVSPDGSKLFVTGASDGATGTLDYATVAYDAVTGAKLWVSRYHGPSNYYDVARALGVSPDGSKLFVTGESGGSTGDHDYATVAYDAATGAQLWTSRYDGPMNSLDAAYALGVGPDGSKLFVTGYSAGSGSYQYATVAYDAAAGTKLWVSRYAGPGCCFDAAYALGVGPDGSKVFVTGQSYSSTGSTDYATVAYDAATGAKLWAKRYDGPGNNWDFARALGVGPDGSKVFVTGQSDSSTGSTDYATVAYNAATGARLWTSRYAGPGNGSDKAYALGVSPDGSKLFVTGQSDGSTGDDYATVAYDTAAGAKLWTSRYDGPGNGGDAANALGVSPDGSKLFVTGQSDGSTGNPDYATIAYPAS